MGVGVTHAENLMIKKLREVREACGLELDQEEDEPNIERNFKTKFEIPNEYSENILITDSDSICQTGLARSYDGGNQLQFETRGRLQKKISNMEFLYRARPGL